MIHQQKFLLSFPWARYSKKLRKKISHPRHMGFFSNEEANQRGMRLAVGMQGEKKQANLVALYLLVDETDGVIADAKFQVFGQSALIGAAEGACELLIRKNHHQARRMTAELIDRHLRDSNEVEAFPEETHGHLNLIIDAIEEAVDQCFDIPFPEIDVLTPLTFDAHSQSGYPGWKELSKEGKIAVIEEIIASDIRPYIELDAGGVQILDFLEDRELLIAYQGACTSCFSATGATLNAIQTILRTKLDPQIIVTPDASFLKTD